MSIHQNFNSELKTKVLIIRFSSIGDIIQSLSAVEGLKHSLPNCELHWVVRTDMAGILAPDTQIDRIWKFDRKAGIAGLLKLARSLRAENFDFVYDAHSNIRSNILKLYLRGRKTTMVVRHKQRLRRMLFFNLGFRGALSMPFRAIESFRKPLKNAGIQFPEPNDTKWSFPLETETKIEKLLGSLAKSRKWVCLVPSAAHELKRWPVEYFVDLIDRLPEFNFVVIGGPTDDFCADIAASAPERVINLAGRTSLSESFALVRRSPFVVSGDTGFLHAADLFNRPGVALMGPSAFGYPSGERMKPMQANLSCIPCSKDGSGTCKQALRKQCLYDIKPEDVAAEIETHFLHHG